MLKQISYDELPQAVRAIVTPRAKFVQAQQATRPGKGDRIYVHVSFDSDWWKWDADPTYPGGWRPVS